MWNSHTECVDDVIDGQGPLQFVALSFMSTRFAMRINWFANRIAAELRCIALYASAYSGNSLALSSLL